MKDRGKVPSSAVAFPDSLKAFSAWQRSTNEMFFLFSRHQKNTWIFLWHPNYPNQIVKECIHFDVLSSHGCKWRRSYTGLVRDGHLWSPMPPWNDGGISCSPKKKVLPKDKTTFRIWHFQLEGQAMGFCQVFTKWMGNVTPRMFMTSQVNQV